jgi:dUTP pyrophosphatase
LAFKRITVLNSPGTVDADYRGEIGVILVNLSNQALKFKTENVLHNSLLLNTIVLSGEVQELSQTARGEGGFGSTGLSK